MFFTSAAALAATSRNTQDFIQNAVIGNRFEIETSQQALEKSKNGAVRDFAQKMVDDHMKAGQKLKDTLQREGLAGLAPTTVDADHRKIENRLARDRADKFDRDYVAAQVDAHKDAVSLFKRYSRNGDDAGLRYVAGRLLPTLREHQQMAYDLRKDYRNRNTVSGREGVHVNRMAPAAGGDMTDNGTKGNPNTDRPQTNADIKTDAPTTANPTEGRSSRSGGPTY
jgi:putative membrane protein